LTKKKYISPDKGGYHVVGKTSTRYWSWNSGDCYNRSRQLNRCDPHLFPVELAHADNLRH